jgi:hypothetical protein
MALLRGQLRGSDETPVDWPRAADGNRFFSGSHVAMQLRDSAVKSGMSRRLLVWMRPATFLLLAKPGQDNNKQAFVDDLVRRGVPFDSLPFLQLEGESESFRVRGHEGRHRMRALQEADVDEAPVILDHSTFRWAVPKSDTFEYGPWPTGLRSETGKNVVPASMVGLTAAWEKKIRRKG